MKRCTLDKIASVTLRLGLDPHAVLGDEIPAEEGTVVAARVLNAKRAYNTLEDVHGRMVVVHPGDIIAGALGSRDALYGYSGRVPEKVAVGDTLQMLNVGGVIGEGAVAAPGIGEPFQLEVLGSVLEFPYLGTRVGVPADVKRAALTATLGAEPLPPVVVLVGTCMDAGKTTAAAALINQFTHDKLRVAAGKLTGVSLRRDVLQMGDCGANPVAVFTDFGVITTTEANAVAAGHSMLAHLSEARPDLIVLEMGDGLLGTYGVHSLLEDPIIKESSKVVVLCAQDPVGAWGGQHLLKERYGLETDVVSGRVSDTPVGMRFCRERLGVEACNALTDEAALARAVMTKLKATKSLAGVS
jgi:hypothetical protein